MLRKRNFTDQTTFGNMNIDVCMYMQFIVSIRLYASSMRCAPTEREDSKNIYIETICSEDGTGKCKQRGDIDSTAQCDQIKPVAEKPR